MSNLAAILLAAGLSRRMRGENKLLKPLAGRPLLSHALEALTAFDLAQLIVVVGREEQGVRPLLPAFATLLRNPSPEDGMGSSIATGAAALTPSLAGVFIVLGDMPSVARADYERLAAAFWEAASDAAVCVPLHRGRRGHPVLFGAAHFAALAGLHGDQGARRVLESAAANVVMVEDCSAGVLADFDTPESFAAHQAQPALKT
jgi:molybdenum cofactor cytidylyltransferase